MVRFLLICIVGLLVCQCGGTSSSTTSQGGASGVPQGGSAGSEASVGGAASDAAGAAGGNAGTTGGSGGSPALLAEPTVFELAYDGLMDVDYHFLNTTTFQTFTSTPPFVDTATVNSNSDATQLTVTTSVCTLTAVFEEINDAGEQVYAVDIIASSCGIDAGGESVTLPIDTGSLTWSSDSLTFFVNGEASIADASSLVLVKFNLCRRSALQDSPECKALTTCVPGEETDSEPTDATDRSCAPCDTDFFSTDNNTRSCAPHVTCGPGESESVAPTSTSDRVCSVCGAGMYLTSDACVPLTECGTGEYESAAPTGMTDRECSPVTVCGSNRVETQAPTSISDRVCSPVPDCAGTPGGLATEDMCGTCDTNPSNDCLQDCAGVWGGTATEDLCGHCDADPNNDCYTEAKLFAQLADGTPDRGASTNFGGPMTISGDFLLVGAPLDDDGAVCSDSICNSGSVYAYERTAGTWQMTQKLNAQLPGGASDVAPSAAFGGVLALEQDTLVAGAGGTGVGYFAGAAYVFVRENGAWAPQYKLVAQLADGTPDAAALDHFGNGVALSGNTIVVGAYRDDDQGSNTGSAYVFIRNGETWSVQQKLNAMLPGGAPDGVANDNFALRVALDGDTLVATTWGDDDQGDESGSAYVFVRSAGIWTPQQKLIAQLPDGTLDGAAGDHFGTSLALSGDALAVGAWSDDEERGSVYVFVRTGGTWSVQQKLVATLPNGTPDRGLRDRFGGVAHLSDDRLFLGALASDQGSRSGAAYLFERDAGVWRVEHKLLARLPNGTLDGNSGDVYSNVTFHGDTYVVGASGDDNNLGSVYVHRLPAAP